MSLDFKPQPGSVVDSGTGLTIYPPRLLPAPPPADPDGIEYQYAIFLDGKRFYGIGLNGSDAVVDKDGRRERVFCSTWVRTGCWTRRSSSSTCLKMATMT